MKVSSLDPTQQIAPALELDGQPHHIVLEGATPAVSLYLHIPFCQSKCYYCDFNSYSGMTGWRERYVAALCQEIAQVSILAPGWRCPTIFFGGGTPSLLASSQVGEILTACRTALPLEDDCEITLEANPGTLAPAYFSEIRAQGVNRLSMGAQSFDERLLKSLGRIHSPNEVREALFAARAGGFTRINLDLMFGLPQQTMAQWTDSLDRALELEPDHLSLYSLIVEDGTPLARWVAEGKVYPADEDLVADMYQLAEEKLADSGYEHYEISNWAKPGQACRHNLTYWHNTPWLGCGAGAYSWFGGQRFSNCLSPQEYVSRLESGHPVVAEVETISAETEMDETAMLGLRLHEGINLAHFQRRFGIPFWSRYKQRLAGLESFDLFTSELDRVSLTARGRLLGNEIFERLFP